ncbi:MAG: hypothetical protein FWE36_07920 [Erysipelotrichales bacterium]|nr:hypothetical protein [Erysipelotrichales bacterium]
MIKNTEELKRKIKEKLNQKADAFIDSLEKQSDTEDFTIDTIEDIMTRFNEDSHKMVIDTVNEVIASFDEKKIIAKKKN